MNWKEILLNLGTPVVETTIADEIGDIVVFQKNSNDEYVVVESSGLLPKKAVYFSEEEIKEEFPDYNLVDVTETISYLVKEIPEGFDEIVTVERLSEKIKNIEALENRITRHIYQLEGLDSIITSLLEPIPTEMILMMLSDALSELFVSTVGIYKLNENDKVYELLISMGSYEIPDVLPENDIKEYIKKRSITKIKGKNSWVIPVGKESKYLILFKRDTNLMPEERSLINAIARMLERTREYLESSERATKLDKVLSELRFVVESFGEFTKKTLNIHDETLFETFIVDMLREMLQLSWAALYKNGKLVKVSSVKQVNIPENLEKFKDSQESFNIKVDGEKYTIVFGDALIKDFLKEVKDVYIQIVFQMVEEAFKNIKYLSEIKERERKISKLFNMLKAIEHFLEDLGKQSTAGDVYSLMFEYIENNLGIKGMIVKVEGMEQKFGKVEDYEHKYEIKTETGSFIFIKDEKFKEDEISLLNSLSKGVSSVLARIYMLTPGEKALDLDDTVLRFLREKAALEGMKVSDLKFYKIEGKADVEKLSKYGVCLIDKEGAILASDLPEEKLEEIGVNLKNL